MKIKQVVLVAALGALLASFGWAAEGEDDRKARADRVSPAQYQTEFVEEEYQGIVQEYDAALNTLQVSGWTFDVSPDVPVTVRGTHGALSLLDVGMQVSVIFRQYEDRRVALMVDQLPDNQEVPLF